ncbi:MAG: ABC transporter permease [Anaerolineales bacterium]|jgi:putative ABC transport system permease protein
MWHLSIRNIRQRWVRSLLTILGVAVSVQIYLAMTTMMSSAENDLQDQLEALAGKVFVQRSMTSESVVEDFPSPSSSINVGVAEELLAMPGVDVARSSAILYVPLTKPPAPGAPPPTRALGIEPGHEIAFLGSLKIAAGAGTLQDPQSVILGQGAAAYYGQEAGHRVEIGETIHVLGEFFTVVGLLDRAPAVHDGMVMMELATAQRLFDRPSSVSAVILAAQNVDEVARIKTQVEGHYPELAAASPADVEENVRAMYASVYSLADMVDGVAILVAFLFVMIVMIIAVMERRRDIGVLRAIGASRATVFGMIASEALLLSVLGALLAGPLWAFIRVFVEIGTVSAADVILTKWLNISLLAILTGLGASLLPAWKAVQVDPLEALRYE